LFVALLLYSTIPLIQSVRWRYALKIFNENINFTWALRYTIIGVFFSNYLPASGGDFVKALLTSAHISAPIKMCVLSVFIEKFFGLAATIALLMLSLYFTIHLPGIASLWETYTGALIPITQQSHYITAAIFIVTSFAFFCFWGKKTKFLATLPQKVAPLRIISRSLLIILIIGFLSQFSWFLMFWFVSKSVGIDISLQLIFILSQLISLAIYLPISFGGWGVRELLLISIASNMGIPTEPYLVMGVLSGLLPVIASAPGFFLWNLGSFPEASQESRSSDVSKQVFLKKHE
jgi:uncharacterized protein (TIRG00374 family)